MNISFSLQKIGFWILTATIFVFPWFFLTTTSEFYEFNKNMLLIFSSFSLLVLWSLGGLIDRQVKITRSPLGLPMLALATTWIASAVLRSPNRVEAFLEPGQAGTWIALAVMFFTGPFFVRSKKDLGLTVYSATISLVVTGLLTILWGSGLSLQISNLPQFLNSRIWNPTGSVLSAGLALASTIPLIGYLAAKQNRRLTSALLSAALLIMVISLGVSAYRLLNPAAASERAAFLPHSTAWGIALETLKISPILGTGPATFLADFTRFRPISFNLTPNWDLRFIASSNYYLHLLSTLGIAGLAAYLFLIKRSYKLVSRAIKIDNTTAISAGAAAMFCFVIQLFFPASLVLVFLNIVYLIILVSAVKLAGTSLVHEANVDIVAAGSTSNTPLLPWIAAVLVAGSTAGIFYLGYRAYAAEVYYQKALVAASQNDGRGTYDNLISAIRQNPYVDRYRVSFSRTNLLLASSIASTEELTDQDRANITQLIQQAIAEAKNAVALNGIKVTNFENLAVVYRNLLNFAEGADAWTIASYQQAIVLDPANPNLRIALGGVLYSQNNWDDAIRLFQMAVDLKPDLANAHYNLAAAYREKGEVERAIASMQTALQLVDRYTSDYNKVLQELDELRQKTPTAQIPPSEEPVSAEAEASELTTPEPLPTPVIRPPIELDESLAPEISPTPSTNEAP